MADTGISAADMARAAMYDPQFRVPVRPRLRRGLSARQHGEALVVHGTPTRHALRGKAISLVIGLLPLLDGSRTHAELAEAVGVAQPKVFSALSLLWTCGVIEECAPFEVDVPEHLADHLSRLGDSTEANPAWEQAAQRLLEARVKYEGDAHHIRNNLPELLESGEPTLVVLAGHRPEIAWHWWERGVPLVQVSMRGESVEIGPYVDPRYTPCLDCLTGDEPSGRLTETAGALAAAYLLGLVSRATPVPMPARWVRVDLDRFIQTSRSGATQPGCPVCSVACGPAQPASLAVRYESAVAMPPREFIDLKVHQTHYQPANIAIQRRHKTWPVCPKRPLPQVDLGLLEAPQKFDVDTVGQLLALAAGWRADTAQRVQRWTASGGNIGSVVAYLIARDVPGLTPGVYGYVASTHELALVRSEVDGGADPATIVLVADLGRVAYKYGPFGLRIVLLDAGCAQTTITQAATAMELPVRVGQSWDDIALARLLGIELDAEPITTVIGVGS